MLVSVAWSCLRRERGVKKVEELKEKSAEGSFADIDGVFEALPYMFIAVCLLLVVAVSFIANAAETHFIKKNGDMYTINAEYTRSYVGKNFKIYDIYKTEGNDAEIQYVMVLAGFKDDSTEPVFGENVAFTVYKRESDTICYVGEKQIHGYDFLSDDEFLLLTEGRYAKAE